MGYIGNKMSERAVQAYQSGEMPISKWTKEIIIEQIMNVLDKPDFTQEDLSKLNKNELTIFLKNSSWHHTGSFYNQTDFYTLNDLMLEHLNKSYIQDIISNREPKQKQQQQQATTSMFVSAYVEFANWAGTRKHPKKETLREVVNFMSDDKMIRTSVGSKRLSSLTILYKVEQKTKFASSDKVMKSYDKSRKQKH